MLCPIGRTHRHYPTRVLIDADTAGLSQVSYIQVQQVRTVSTERLTMRLGRADAAHLGAVERILALLLQLR